MPVFVLCTMRTLVVLLMAISVSAGADVARFGRFEQSFTSSKEYGNPLKDAEVTVEFSGPGNTKDVVRAFWDGGKNWKVRYSPEVAGDYSFKVTNSDRGDQALNSQTGMFHVTEAAGTNPVYRYGAPRLSSDRHYLVQSGARPFFYLGDTAWNGALLSTDAEWKQYLADRASKGFTAIQIVMTQWRAGPKDENGKVAYQYRRASPVLSPVTPIQKPMLSRWRLAGGGHGEDEPRGQPVSGPRVDAGEDQGGFAGQRDAEAFRPHEGEDSRVAGRGDEAFHQVADAHSAPTPPGTRRS